MDSQLRSKSWPRRFAPLDLSKKHLEDQHMPILKGIVFDVDGTLCKCSSMAKMQTNDVFMVACSGTNVINHN